MWSLVLIVAIANMCSALACPASGVVGLGYQNLRRNPGAMVDLQDPKDTQYYDNNEGGTNPEDVEPTTDTAENLNTENANEPSEIVLVAEKILGDKDAVTEPTSTDDIETTNAEGIDTTIAEGEEMPNGDGDSEETTNADGVESTNGNEELNNVDGQEAINADGEESTDGNSEETTTVQEATAGDITGDHTDPTNGENKQTTKSGRYSTSTRCTLDENFDIPSAEATTNATLEVAETTHQALQGEQGDDGPLKNNLTETTFTTTRAPYEVPKNEFTDTIFIDDN